MNEQPDLAREGKVRRWLAGLTLGTVIALAVLPATGWIIREQLKSVASALVLQPTKINFSEESPTDRARIREIAARRPDDFPLQFAAAARLDERRRLIRERTPFASRQAEEWPGSAYADVAARFAGNPSLHANLLRLAAGTEVIAKRSEAAELEGKPAGSSSNETPELNHPETLASFLDRTAAGERLDPENAYFPVMASVALFAGHRDAEALEALQRAAAKSQWREYYQDQNYGNWRLDEALGQRGAIIRTGRAASQLFPNYAQIRNVARMACYLAMKAEQEGDSERGFLIRHDVLRLGSAMRSQGQLLITNLVGAAIVRLAMSRPGGSPAPPRAANAPSGDVHRTEKDHRVAEAYQAYVTHIGHPEEAAWVREEEAAGSRLRVMLTPEVIGIGLERPLYTTTNYWSAGAMLLLNAVWWGLLGLAAAGLAGGRWGRSGQPVPVAWKQGMALGVGFLGTVPALACLLGSATTEQMSVSLVFAVLVGMPVMGLLWLYRSRGNHNLRQSLAGAAVIGLLFPAAIALLTAQGMATGTRLEFYGPSSQAEQAPALLGMIGGTLGLPLLAAVVFAIAGRVLRMPAGISLVRGFRGAAGPMVCLLLLAYGGMVLATTRQEARLEYHLNRNMENEGRFIAELAGKSWPGPVR